LMQLGIKYRLAKNRLNSCLTTWAFFYATVHHV